MDSIRIVWERVLMAVAFFIGTALFFLLYMDNIEHKHIEQVCTQFAYEVSKDGELTLDEYYRFIDNLGGLDIGLSVELSHTTYETEPYYSFRDVQEVADYFSARNLLTDAKLPLFPVVFPSIAPERLVLQDKTNAGVLSSLSSTGLVPLPDDNVTSSTVYVSVCDTQKVYQGEKLCTVVRVTENGMSYYSEADMATAGFTGAGIYELKLNGVSTGATVAITSYPRTVICSNGHETLFTPERIAEYEATGNRGKCPFCALEPQSITANVSSVSATVGTPLNELGVLLTVTYMDGHTEALSLSDKELYCSYDSFYCGTQDVRFSYKGYESTVFSCTLSGGLCSICSAECTGRSKSDYDRMPFCNTCLSGTPMFMGETYSQKGFMANDDIITELLDTGLYLFERDDLVTVKVSYQKNGIPLPFLSRNVKIPVIISETIRTSGNR